MYLDNYQEYIQLTGISTAQLNKNLISDSKMKKLPNISATALSTVLDDLIDASKITCKEKSQIGLNLAKYQANEIFNDAIFKNWISKQYLEYVEISTDPTQQGMNIDIFNPLYPVKRIVKRPIKREMLDETYLLIKRAEEQGLINVTFKVKEIKEGKERSDEIKQVLKRNYLCSIPDNAKPEERKSASQFNILRNKILEQLLNDLAYPFLQKQARSDLLKTAENYVIAKCQEKFKHLLMIKHTEQTDKKPNLLSLFIEQDNSMTVAFIDNNGKPLECLHFKYFLIAKKIQNQNIVDQFQQECTKLRAGIQKHCPETIIISANSKKSRQVRTQFLDMSQDGDFWPEFMDTTIPQMLSKTEKYKLEFPTMNQSEKICVSMGRMYQFQCAEVLNLWSYNVNDNFCLQLPLHLLQNEVTQNKLQEALEKVSIICVNQLGVDINKILRQPHLESQLQFVNGLGFRKANFLLHELRSNHNSYISKRMKLWEEKKILQKKVLINCCAFMKIKSKEAPLDQTRIHNENYFLVKSITTNALDEKYKDNELTENQMIQKIMADPSYLDALDLEDYSNHLAKTKGKHNMIYIINMIKDELKCPFMDPRKIKEAVSDKDLFYSISKENVHSFRKHMIVNCQIKDISDKQIFVTLLDNQNITGIIKAQDCDLSCNELTACSEIKGEDVVRAIVLSIDAMEERRSSKSTEKEKDFLRVSLGLMKAYDWEKALKELHPNLDKQLNYGYFQYDARQDFPDFSLPMKPDEKQKNMFHSMKKINHPKFKQMGLLASEQYLKDQLVGDFVIRPSSRSHEMINLSWKFFDNIYVHLGIRVEEFKNKLTNSYYLAKQQFESIDEIIENYIDPCNSYIQGVIQHPKMLSQISVQQIEEKIIEEKQQQPEIIQYYFGFNAQCPQYIVLLYSISTTVVKSEYIKVKQNGLNFHDQVFNSLRELVTWFKKNHKTQDYKRWARKTKPPLLDKQKSEKKKIIGSDYSYQESHSMSGSYRESNHRSRSRNKY